MSLEINKLYSAISDCRYVDQIRFRKRLRNTSKIKEIDKRDEVLQTISTEIELALSVLSEKQQQHYLIAYPPNLPVSQHSSEITEAIKSNQIVIIAGETGSGKTTQLPKACIDAGLGFKGLIGHTQPRRLAARTVSTRIAQEMQVELGGAVGYQVRFTDQVSDKTLIKVMTDGILLTEIKHDRYLNKYDAIIIDEAHERSLNIDFLLGYLKRLLPKRPELKLIITSATIDVDRFSSFFNDAPVFSVSGRSYPVDINYRPAVSGEEFDQSLSQQIADVIDEIFDEEKSRGWGIGDILVFLPGEREIRDISKQLKEYNWRDTEVLPLYARLSNKDQNRVFQSHSGRRVVLATNVAETSITVPGIRYVIDPGTVRISRYSYRSKLQRLPVEAISQASANQRKGRCGRISEGICYRLYGEDDFNSRAEFTDPEILRTSLAAVILKMIDSGLGEVNEFEFLDQPDNKLWNDGFKLLFELEAVDEDKKLTPLGKRLAALPTDPRLAKMLLSAANNKSLREVLIIVSGLSIQDPRERPTEKQQAADQAHSQYKDPDSDFLGFLKLWQSYEEQRQILSNNQLKRHCQKNYLSYMRMREWREIHRQLHLVLKSLKLVENDSEASYDSIHQSLLSGLLGNIGKHDEKREYQACRNRKFLLFPGSNLNKKKPKWLFSAEIVETQHVFARYNARIEPQWIEPLATHLIKKSWSEPHWETKRAQVIAKEKVTLYGLEIISNRLVNYGNIDAQASREIFIRAGLVESGYATRVSAVKHNNQLIASLEAIEDRTRRKDVVVDDEVVFSLYDEKIPANIVSGASFEKWFKRLPSAEQTSIFFNKSDLVRQAASDFDPSQFPEHLENNGIRFPLSYQFDPSANEDGVTISVPLNAIRQLTVEALEKLVPGLLREKCIQLIKNLPRTLRKNFVPVPDVVDAVLPKIEASDKPFIDALTHELKRKTLCSVPIEAWNFDLLDKHLRFNIQVVDNKGKVIDQGRDLIKVAEKVEHLIDQSAVLDEAQKAPNKRYTSWDFDKLEKTVSVKQAGIEMTQFPALLDKSSFVEQVYCSDELEAKRINRLGMARLMCFRLKQMSGDFERLIKSYKKLGLLYSPVGQAKPFYDDFLLASVANHFFEEGLPYTLADFDLLYEQKRSTYIEQTALFSDLVFIILEKHHALMKKLKGKMNIALAMPLNDLSFQLSNLVFNCFLQQTSYQHLKNVPRYLDACLFRHDKMARDMANERRYIPILNAWWEQYLQRKKQLKSQGIWDEKLDEFRWLIEEQRVSWFAQQLGTTETVSEKRLNKLWESIRR
jgi:ATP-dependent helicase HrpA